MALGYFVDAEKYLSEAVASPDHPWVAKNLATLKAQLATAKTQIGELYIVGEPAGAEVLVNGKPVGRLPLSSPIRLDKGRADVQVRAPGYVASSDSVVMVGGKREDRSYRLQREAVAVAPPPPPPPVAQPAKEMPKPVEAKPAAPSVAMATPAPAPAAGSPTRISRRRQSPRRPRTAAAATIRICVRLLGAWASPASLAWCSARSKASSRSTSATSSTITRTRPPEIPDCNTTAPTPACQGIQDSHASARTLSIIGFVAGGALTAGAAVLWVLSSPKERASGSSTAIACTPDFGTRGVACRMQF